MASGPTAPEPTDSARRVFQEAPGSGDAASLLGAARPVVWRGAGELLQVPWGRPPKGTWLVIDLWAGFSGLCLALLSLGFQFYAIAAEKDPAARKCAQAVMSSLVHVGDVEDVTVAALLPFLAKRNIRGIIVGGGSPCQGNSTLNRQRQGLADDRSMQPALLASLVHELREHPATQGIDVFAFLENVASSPPEVLERYSDWLQTKPILLDAASCGWVSRRRPFWVSSRRGGSRSAAPTT